MYGIVKRLESDPFPLLLRHVRFTTSGLELFWQSLQCVCVEPALYMALDCALTFDSSEAASALLVAIGLSGGETAGAFVDELSGY